MWETWVWSLDWEDPLEKGKATHSSILAWRIPWTKCMGSDTTERLSLLTFRVLPSCSSVDPTSLAGLQGRSPTDLIPRGLRAFKVFCRASPFPSFHTQLIRWLGVVNLKSNVWEQNLSSSFSLGQLIADFGRSFNVISSVLFLVRWG